MAAGNRDDYQIDTPTFEWIKNNLKLNYEEYVVLDEKESLKDPESEPYKSLYIAREKLFLIKEIIDSGCPPDISSDNKTCLRICIHFLLGCNYFKTDEISSAQKEFENVLELAKEIPCKGEVAILMVSALNQLGIIWCNRSDEYEKSLNLLLEAKSLYDDNVSSSLPPLGERDWLKGFPRELHEREHEFEDLHTHTLFYLAQVYTHLEQPYLSAQYCQATLSRQLEMKSYDAIDWSINAATLSQYYINNNNFPQARHCLAAATVVFGRFDNEAELLDDEDFKEKLQRTSADISRCWIKYCILLLKESSSEGKTKEKVEIVHRFEPLELAGVENEVTCDWIENKRVANNVFLFGQKQATKAKEFYNLENHASDHASIIQDHSHLYKLLIIYEHDLSLKCRLLKRRVDLLSSLLSSLNPQYFLVLNRELMYELGDIYAEMAYYKIILASGGGEGEKSEPSLHQIRKINSLLQDGIKQYQNYFDSFDRNEIDANSPYLGTYLTSKLNISRLHAKLIGFSPQEEIKYLEISLKGYQWLVDYAEEHEENVKSVFEEEITLCKEMIELLPQKIEIITTTGQRRVN